MTLTRSALLLAVLLPLAGPPALLGQADTPLSTDRPDFTEGPSPVAAGRFQLEAGYTFTREDRDDHHPLGEGKLTEGQPEYGSDTRHPPLPRAGEGLGERARA